MESTPQAYVAALRQAQEEADALVLTLTPEQFNWKPSPNDWSVAECIVHLNRVNAPYIERLEAGIAAGGPAGQGPFRYGWLSRLFIGAMVPETKRRLKTMASMDPADGGAASDFEAARVLADFKALTDQMIGVVQKADGLDLSRVKTSSPFLKLLRLPVGAFLEALAGHNLRHLAQARRVTAHPGFPVENAPATA